MPSGASGRTRFAAAIPLDERTMSYVPRAQRERQKWMTLKEAVSHIRQVDDSDEEIALKDLRAALADGEVESRWANERASQFFVIPIIRNVAPRVEPKAREEFWLTVPIDLDGGGTIPELWLDNLRRTKDQEGTVGEEDDDDDDDTPSRYFVFVLKDKILEIWKGQELEKTGERQPQASDDEIRDALRDIFKDIEDGKIRQWDRNMVHRWVEAKVDPKRAPRKVVLDLIDKTPEFAKYKRKRGKPKKK
jgi:hypothetical protein